MAEEQRSARAIVRISAVPDSDLHRVLNGTVDSTRRVNRRVLDETIRAQREQERVAKRQSDAAAREAKRGADAQIRETKRASDQTVREAQRAGVRQEREAKRLADAAIREAERSATQQKRQAADVERYKQRVGEAGARLQIRMNADMARERQASYRTQVRDAERAQRDETRNARVGSQARRRLLVGMGGAAVGGAVGAAGLVSQGQGLAGVGTLEQRLSAGGDFRQEMITTANEARATPEERKAVEEAVLRASEKTNISIGEMASALTNAQQNFDQFKQFAGIIGDLAEVSAGKGTALQDLVNVMGAASTGFNLTTDKEKKDFLDVLISTSERGSIEAGAVGRELGPLMPQFAMRTGRTGVPAAREFLALGQVLGKSQPGQAAEVATQTERFLLELSEKKTQQKLKAAGVQVTEGGKIGGQLKDMGEIGQLMVQSKKFQKSSVRQGVFSRTEALKASEFLMSALQDDPEAFRKLQNTEAGAGLGSAQSGFSQLQADPMFKLRQVGSRAQAGTVRDSDRIVKTITPAVEEMTKLQSKFPLLNESFSVLNTTVRSLITAMVADRLIFGRHVGMVSESAKSASAALSGSTGLAGKLGAAGQAAGVFALAFMGTKAILEATGADKALEGAGGAVHDLIHGDGAPRQAGRAFDAGGGRAPLTREERTAPGRAYEDAELLKAAIREGNKKDPLRVVLEVKNGVAVVTRTEEGTGATIDYTQRPLGYTMP